MPTPAGPPDAAPFLDLPVGVVVRVGDALASNREAERLTGYTSAELGTVRAWFERLFPNGDEHARQALERALADGPRRPVSLELRRKDDA